MNKPSTSGLNPWESTSNINSATLNLSVNNKAPVIDEEIEDDDIEEVEVDERERLHLQEVSSLVEAAYQRVEKFSKEHTYKVSSAGASEESSCPSTFHPLASLPESIDGGKAEVEELKNLPVSFESALRLNQVLQRRLNTTLQRLEKTLQQNLLRQVQLKEEEEEQGLMNPQDKEYRECRDKYYARPSSFAIPYFKDRTGTPAPMNQDAKRKVELGYLDLYSTRLRTWLTSEQNTLVKEVRKEWKNRLISDWNNSLKTAERKLKNELTEKEKREVEKELKTCQNHINFFTNVAADKIDMPRGVDLDWDKVSAQAFDGFRTTEECHLLWENYLHPSINKSVWTEEEDVEIQSAVLECEEEKPDWKILTEKLGTGRTAFQVMQRWVSFIRPTINPVRWTAEASKKLEDTVNMLRVGTHIPWAQVARHLTGYTTIQLQSRWRLINPDASKGPFTSEEDFILIKGLYKLGMNFDVIAHFLPGRTKYQVRDRFKRAILPGLTWKPWTWKEDKKIIVNCSMESQHWRRMAMLMPDRDTCQIRLRFYILHFWQSISPETRLPPPLFPLSMTTKPIEIKKLREKMGNLTPDVRVYLDSIKASKDTNDLTDRSMRSFEERRAAIVKKKDKETLAKFLTEKGDEPATPPIVMKKKRGRYGPRTPSWPDMALTQFFLPGRKCSSASVDPEDEKVGKHLHRLGQALQIKINKSVTADDISCLQDDHVVFEESIIEDVFVKHHAREDYGGECLACFNQNPEIIPLMPPNRSTVGAFRSLLLHKPKLDEMATKDFLLFQVPRSQLHKLGMKAKTLGERAVNKTLEIDELEVTETQESQDRGLNGEVEDPDSVRNGEINDTRGRKRKAATMANFVNYIYSQEASKPKLLRGPVVRKEVFDPPSKTELLKMQLEGEHSCFRRRAQNIPNRQILAFEDRLLFHRFLSLFFWPALFTLIKPSKKIVYLSGELSKEAKFRKLKLPETIFETGDLAKKRSHLTSLDEDEQEKLVKTMEAVRNRKMCEYKRLFGKLDGTLNPEDMKKRIFKKNIVKLKRSLVMKKTWKKKRQGIPPKKIVKKDAPPATRPRSRRIEAVQRNRIKKIEEEERRLQREELEREVQLATERKGS